MHPSRGHAEFGPDGEQYLAMGSPGMELGLEHQQQFEHMSHMPGGMVGGLETGNFSNNEMF